MIYLISLITVVFILTTIYLYLRYKKLQLKDQALSLAFEISREGVYFMNLNTEKTELSTSYYNLLGYKPNEISFDMKTWINHIHPEDREWVTRVYKNIEAENDTYISIEYRLKTKEDDYIWVLDRSKVVEFDDSGKAMKSIGTVIQIDQIKRAEKEIQDKNQQLNEAMSKLRKSQAQLIEMERMTAMSMITSGIAYELNNPLNYVKGNVHPIRNDFKEIKEYMNSIYNDEALKKSSLIKTLNEKYNPDELFEEIELLLDGIESGAQKSLEIVKTLKMFFADQNTEKPMILNLHDNINSAIKMLHSKISNHITIHKNFGEVEHINGWPGKLNQVFTSLLSNSIEAKNPNEKGNIYIKTYQKNNRIHILFEDDGYGINEEIKDKIFDPFFTTKPESNGLGLSIVKAVVHSHNGKIEVSSENRKTSVHISLPVSLHIPV